MRPKAVGVCLACLLASLLVTLPALAQPPGGPGGPRRQPPPSSKRRFALRARKETGPRTWYIPIRAVKTPEGRQRLLTLIREEFDFDRRMQEAVRLGDAGDVDSARLIMRMYNEAEYRSKYKGMQDLAMVLGDLGAGRATPRFIDSSRSPVPAIRLAGVTGLARIGDKRAVPVLISCLNDKDPKVAEVAKWGLSNLTGQPPADRPAPEWEQWWKENGDSLPPITVLSVQRNIILREEVKGKLLGVASKKRAISTLGALKGPEGIRILVEALRQMDERLQAGKETGEDIIPAVSIACRDIAGTTFGLGMTGTTLESRAVAMERWYKEKTQGGEGGRGGEK